MEKKNALFPLTIALALVLGMLIGLKFKNNDTRSRILFFAPPPGKTHQTLEIIKRSYVDSISINMLEDEAIKGMLKKLDPHSQYISAANFSAANDPLEGNFSGIGVHYNMFNDTIVIINTIAEGPSEKAGIIAGDRIVKVDDLTVAGVRMRSDEIVNMLKGVTGTTVNVGIHRKGAKELLDITITRGRVPIFSIDAAYMIASETGYIKVNRFSRTTFQEFSDAVERLTSEGMTKMILDLRDNPGGLIEGAIKMSEMFLPAGNMIVYTEGNERERVNHYSKARNALNVELALLIDETSASASEIVAGAIQDNDRGTIIGRRSFGKGLVQEQHTLSDGSAVRITVSRYYTPTGRCIQKPYDNDDKTKYFNELNIREEHGEMTNVENISFNESLKYITPAGKVVYGGGGIMPDIFVPVDTTSFSNYFSLVTRRGLLYRFAFEYSDKNRRELANITDHKNMQTFLRRKNILGDFVDYAAKQGIAKNEKDLKISGTHIENVLMAQIAQYIINENGIYPIINQMDNIVQKGIFVLNN